MGDLMLEHFEGFLLAEGRFERAKAKGGAMSANLCGLKNSVLEPVLCGLVEVLLSFSFLF
jgi:hypothetical protein